MPSVTSTFAVDLSAPCSFYGKAKEARDEESKGLNITSYSVAGTLTDGEATHAYAFADFVHTVGGASFASLKEAAESVSATGFEGDVTLTAELGLGISNFGAGGGGGGAVAAAGGAAAGGDAGAAAAEEAPEEKEEPEEVDLGGGMDMFGGGDDY